MRAVERRKVLIPIGQSPAAVLYSAAEAPPQAALCLSPTFLERTDRELVARKARIWKGARTPQALKRVRQALRRRAVNRRTRSAAKTLVQHASNIALGRDEGDAAEAVSSAITALDKAAEKGIIHRNNAARRKSRLMAKVNAAHLFEAADAGPKRKTTASKTAQRKRVAAAKASKAAAGKAADRPRTAAGKAKVAVTRASREASAAKRRAKTEESEEG
ncbi:MAG: 30S ribosomal protein S20 [Chloroflexi bacterium]|nr:MAG: 30S ribosomal protein S20 [Chloroflexota bacterium]